MGFQVMPLASTPSAELIPDDEAALRDVICQALNIPIKAWPAILSNVPRERLRSVWHDGRIIAGGVTYAMGQWFGGRSVPSAGVSLVGVAPHRRGSGAAKALITWLLREAREQGLPLASLYASSQRVYRSMSFEQAGHRVLYELELQHIGRCAKRLELHPAPLESPEPFLKLYRWQCERSAGLIERTPGLWTRILKFLLDPEARQFAYVLGDPAEPEGYVILRHEAVPNAPYKLVLRDYVVRTPAAAETLWNFIAGHRSMATSVIWSGSNNDPLLCLPDEHRYLKTIEWHRWMLRIVDVRAALETRGYPPDVTAELHIEVTDELIPENAARFVVSIEGGSAHVERGGDGSLRMDIKGLAPLYSGMLTPAELQRVGWLEGDDDSLHAAAQIFRGPQPWIVEMF